MDAADCSMAGCTPRGRHVLQHNVLEHNLTPPPPMVQQDYTRPFPESLRRGLALDFADHSATFGVGHAPPTWQVSQAAFASAAAAASLAPWGWGVGDGQ